MEARFQDFTMLSDNSKSNGYGRLHPQTVIQRSEGQGSGPMKVENLEDEAEANESKYADVATVVDADGLNLNTEESIFKPTYLTFDFEPDEKTKEVVNTKPEIELAEENDTDSPSSPAVIVMPNEGAEKNLNFDLVFPFGHNFMLEGEKALAVLVAKESSNSDQSGQYENYDEWLSRISTEHSQRRPIRASEHDPQEQRQVTPLRTIVASVPPPYQSTTKTEQACVTDDEIPAALQNTLVSQPRLVVKEPEQLNEPTLETSLRIDSSKIKNCSDDNINTTSVPHRENVSADIPDTLQYIVADNARHHDPHPRLVVKRPEQLNESILDKIMQRNHNFRGDANRIIDCNIDNINDSHFSPSCQRSNKMDQECAKIVQQIVNYVKKSRESRPKLVVKKPEKVMRLDINYFSDANKADNCNVNNRNGCHAPHFCQRSNKMDQVCVSDKEVPSILKRILENTISCESRPRLAVKNPVKLNDPTPEKTMRLDHNFSGNADKTKYCDVDNINASSNPLSSQSGNKVDQVCWADDISCSLADMSKSRESRQCRSKMVVKKRIPAKIMRVDKIKDMVIKIPELQNEPIPEKRIRLDKIKDCNVNVKDDALLSGKDNFDRSTSDNFRGVRETLEPTQTGSATFHDTSCSLADMSKSRESRESRSKMVVKKRIPEKIMRVDKIKDIVIKMPELKNEPIPEKRMRLDKIKDCNVINVKDDALLSGKDNFNWSTSDNFRGVRETFEPTQTGSATFHDTIYDAFRAYWDDDILTHVVAATNRYANSPSQSESFKKQWYNTNIHEILVLFAFWMMLGVIRMPTVKSCFSNDPLLKVNVFRTMFAKSRYNNLVSALSFTNSDSKKANCFGPILNHLSAKFQYNFVPAQNVSIIDSLLVWKEALPFHQVQTKKTIRTFDLCDNATGYLWSFLIHMENYETDSVLSQSNSTIQKREVIVSKLIRPLLNKGYTLYMNSSLNSPTLARFLKKNKTDCVGIITSSSKGCPLYVRMPEPGQITATHCDDVCVLACHGKETVLYVSTYHGTVLRESSNHQTEDCDVVADCNTNLNSVEIRNEMLEPYVLAMETKRCGRWYIKFFKRMINCSILNAQILLESSRKKKVDHLAARLQLVDSILQKHMSLSPALSKSSRQAEKLPPCRTSGSGHWPALYSLDATDRHQPSQPRCVFCVSRGYRNKTTLYKCEECDVPLCILCFKGFHSQ